MENSLLLMLSLIIVFTYSVMVLESIGAVPGYFTNNQNYPLSDTVYLFVFFSFQLAFKGLEMLFWNQLVSLPATDKHTWDWLDLPLIYSTFFPNGGKNA